MMMMAVVGLASLGPPALRILGPVGARLLSRLNIILELREGALRLRQVAGRQGLAEGIEIVRDRVIGGG